MSCRDFVPGENELVLLARSLGEGVRNASVRKMRFVEMFFSAFNRRLIHALVVVTLAWFGIGEAHAADQHPYGEEAYQHCKQYEAQKLAQYANHPPGSGYAAAPSGCTLGHNYWGHGVLEDYYMCYVTYYNPDGSVRNSANSCDVNVGAYSHSFGMPDTHAFPVNVMCPAGKVWKETSTGGVCLPAIDPGKNNECCKADSVGSPTGPVGVGNPINMFVGNKTEVVQDYADPKGHLSFSRYYSSLEIPVNPGTVLGTHWRHTYQTSIVPKPSSNDRNLNRASGNSYTYRNVLVQSVSQWLPDKDVSERLAAVMSGSTQVGWTATTSNNVIERYDSAGTLTQIEYPDGDIVQATYDAQGRLSRVSDRQGRALVLAYANNLLDNLALPDGQVLKYSYDAHQRLVTVTHYANAGSQPLSSVQYRYEDPNDAKLLTGIIDENNQRYATWSYDAAGRAISSYHGTGADQVTVAYGADRSTVTGPLGAPVEYGYQLALGRAKLASAQKLCPSCSSQSFQSRTYDANGYPDRFTDFAGTATDNDYNSRGLLTQRIDSDNVAAAKRVTQTDWDANRPLPTEWRVYDAAGGLVGKQTWTYNSRGQVLTRSVIEP